MSTQLRPTSFLLVGLTLVDVGPLRGTTSVTFRDETGRPTNIYLIMGPNGAGKTTVLEGIYRALALLGATDHPTYGMEGLDDAPGGLQLDARIVLDDGNRGRLFLLSIVAGDPGLLKVWTPEDLASVEAEEQIVLQFERRGGARVTRAQSSSEFAIAFADAVCARIGDPTLDLFESANSYPTVLYFPSNRGIRQPPPASAGITRPPGLAYQPAHLFDTDGASWASSLDNLFVWFAWLADKREERCRELVNKLVFHGRKKRLGPVDRQGLFVPVEIDEFKHRLHQLSSGERQLVQLVVRIASHMTRSTIVLIDETEQHLHLVMRRRLLNIIKTWARDFEGGLSFVMTSHQSETFRLLAPTRPEPGLSKSGCLVKPRFTRPPQ